jgi:hypothetical protein
MLTVYYLNNLPSTATVNPESDIEPPRHEGRDFQPKVEVRLKSAECRSPDVSDF